MKFMLLLIPFPVCVSTAELQEKDLEDSRNCQALFDVDNSGPEVLTYIAQNHSVQLVYAIGFLSLLF